MLPLLVPALEAFGDFLLGEVLQYGVKKVVKKTLFKGIAKNKKNLPIPVKKPISLKKSISKKNNSVSAFTKQKKSFSIPVKNGSFGNNKVSLPLKPYNNSSNSNNNYGGGGDIDNYQNNDCFFDDEDDDDYEYDYDVDDSCDDNIDDGYDDGD